MCKRNAEEILKYIISTFTDYLKELSEKETDEFGYGEKTAYVECLEIIQRWEKAKENGLDFEIEKFFSLERKESSNHFEK